MVGHGGSSAGSYLADPTSPIPSHCASIVVNRTLRVKAHFLSPLLQVGSSVKLQCHFGAPGEHIPEWAFGDIALVHGDKYSISQDSTNSMLTIQNASKCV